MYSVTMSEESASEPTEGPLKGYKSISEFTKDGYKCLVEATRHANALPTGGDWNFYSTFESFTNVLQHESTELMDNIMNLLKKSEVVANMRNQTTEMKLEILVEANDIILERVANELDEIQGIKKTAQDGLVTVSAEINNINGSWNRRKAMVKYGMIGGPNREHTVRLLTAENIGRPQKEFKDKIDNSNEPWEPRIQDKPNSLKPLAIFLEETGSGIQFSHPYEYELDRFTPPVELLSKIDPILPKNVPLVEVNNVEQLKELLEDLRKFKIIAIDLEHHSYRSFMGITCLMQISTGEKDYLIDTLSLRSDLWILNEIFTDPKVVKVFHGAESDIFWLQRDLSLYVVNMFDTFYAAQLLEYTAKSLAYLLQRFCSFITNKQFQLADWRIRPLPEELKSYARDDTHYLIYIYQRIRNELIDKANGDDNLLKSVIDRSTQLCKKRYTKPIWHETVHMEFYRRCHRSFDNRQLYALKHLYQWRDTTARNEDESVAYVMPNNMLLEISARLPKEMQGILACCSPVPPLVRASLLELHKIVLKALEQPFEQPIMKEDSRARGSTNKFAKVNMDSPLNCPHDLTKNPGYDYLDTLIGAKRNPVLMLSDNLEIEAKTSVWSIFDIAQPKKCEKLDNFKFLSPYERYKLVRPFVVAKEKRLAEQRANKAEKDKQKQLDDNKLKQQDEQTRTDADRIESVRQHFLELQKKTLLELGGSKKRKAEDDSPIIIDLVDVPVERKNNKRKLENPDGGVAKKVAKRELNRRRKAKRKQKKANAIQQTVQQQEPNPDFNAYNYSMVDFRQFQGGAGSAQQSRLKTKFHGKKKTGVKRKQQYNRSMTFGLNSK